ncbi:MAG TPA: adenylyltransferase, partial [Desulfobulbaceae bacterium]|nr:adenylyltransferase [Desulfobulbaceae bacterium]
EALRAEALECKAIDLNTRQLCDLELLMNRGLYPLSGYMGQTDYKSVLARMRLADGTVWPIPICLDVTEAEAGRLIPGERVALNDQEGFLLA